MIALVSFFYLSEQSKTGAAAVRSLSAKKSELSTLLVENDDLNLEIEQSINLPAIQETAMKKYGMKKPAQSKVIAYDSKNVDYVRQYNKIPKVRCGFVEKKKYKKTKRINNAMRVRLCLYRLIAILFICLMGRLVYFSVAKIMTYEKVLAQQNYQSQTFRTKGERYLDRNGNTLATSQKLYSLVLERKISCAEQTQKNALNALTKYMDLDWMICRPI